VLVRTREHRSQRAPPVVRQHVNEPTARGRHAVSHLQHGGARTVAMRSEECEGRSGSRSPNDIRVQGKRDRRDIGHGSSPRKAAFGAPTTLFAVRRLQGSDTTPPRIAPGGGRQKLNRAVESHAHAVLGLCPAKVRTKKLPTTRFTPSQHRYGAAPVQHVVIMNSSGSRYEAAKAARVRQPPGARLDYCVLRLPYGEHQQREHQSRHTSIRGTRLATRERPAESGKWIESSLMLALGSCRRR